MRDSKAFYKARLNLEMLFPACTSVHREVTISWKDTETSASETRTVMLNLVQNIQEGFMHAAVYIEELDSVGALLPHVLSEHMPQMMNNTEIITSNDRLGDLPRSNRDAKFTNTIYLLYDRLATDKDMLAEELRGKGLFPVFCDEEYLENHLASGSLDIFICHDSTEKLNVARPLAHELIKRRLTVWLDELSLSIGDSLIDTVELGLQETKCAVIVVSKTFLHNEGWTKREFKSLVSRELSEGRKIILPLWHEVNREEVAKYSIELADKFALNTEQSMSTVAKLIHQEVAKQKA